MIRFITFLALYATMQVVSALPATAGEYKAWVCEDPSSNSLSAKFSTKMVHQLLQSGSHPNCRSVNAAYVKKNTRRVLFDLEKVRIIMHQDALKTMIDTLGK